MSFFDQIKEKIIKSINPKNIILIDNSSLHKKHKSFDLNKVHLKIIIESEKLKKMNKPIIAHYHGQDIRTRGVFHNMDQMADLNLTSEIDLISQYEKLNYFYILEYQIRY